MAFLPQLDFFKKRKEYAQEALCQRFQSGLFVFLSTQHAHSLADIFRILCNIYHRLCEVAVADVALPLVVGDEFLASDNIFAGVTAFPCLKTTKNYLLMIEHPTLAPVRKLCHEGTHSIS